MSPLADNKYKDIKESRLIREQFRANFNKTIAGSSLYFIKHQQFQILYLYKSIKYTLLQYQEVINDWIQPLVTMARFKQRLTLGLTAALLATMTEATLNNTACQYKMFPIFAGGSKTEDVLTVEVDPISQYIFVGGKTDSSNFAPAENPHSYVYAVSPAGDWMWGQFFYNVSYAVSRVDGIVMSSNYSSLTCLGQANNKPIIMNLNKKKGQIQKFFTIDPMEPTSSTVYTTLQAIHMEEKNPEDNQTYFYVSFQQGYKNDRLIHVLKFGLDLKLQWHYARIGVGTNSIPVQSSAKDDYPRLLSMDSSNSREFYLMGKFRTSAFALATATPTQGAMLFKFSKVDGKILYQVTFAGMDDIYGYVQPAGTNYLYGCGHQSGGLNPRYFKISSNGDSQFHRALSMAASSYCQGITYDQTRFETTLLILSNDENYKAINQKYTGSPNDAFIFVISDGGVVSRGRQISFSPTSIVRDKVNSIMMGTNSLRRIGQYYVFGGQTTGFATKMQSLNFDPYKDNSFAMKYLLDKDGASQCILESEVDSNPGLTESTMTKADPKTWKDTDEIIQYSRYYQVYSSPYSGAFDLLDTMYIPRPCASSYANLTQMDYFYGQRKKSYNMRDEPSYKQRAVTVFSMMDRQREFIFQNGSSCSAFAWLDSGSFEKNTTIWVQTDEENLVGTQRTIIRGCDSMSRLHEINFYVNVTSNSAPEFTEGIQTQWNLNVGDKFNYKLPPFKDPEGNDVGEVYINSMENQDFPAFINYTNATKTIAMNPNNLLYQGRTYYFSVVLKELNSDFMMNIYYMTIKINGDPIDPEDLKPPNKTEVSMTLQYLNYSSMGQIKFSMAVMPFVFLPENKAQFWDVFDVYVINTLKDREEIQDIEFNIIDNSTVNFTVMFNNPYMYGLLNKKSDNLMFRCKNVSDEALVGLVVLNTTNQTFKVIDENNNTCKLRIPMQFDFRDDQMTFYRNLAVALYYVMIVIILLQFVLLLFRNVTLLPLWTLVEYMQLIAFMPLYNFKLIPYLYDAFKPMLVGHIILFNDSMLYKEMSDDYFNINYEYYWLPISKLIQSLMNIMILFLLLVLVNIGLYIMTYCTKEGSRFREFVDSKLAQFKFNAYIRFYMLAYFDFTFFSIMKILEGKNDTVMRKVATFFSYAFFVTSIVIPVFFLAVILRKFSVLPDKEGKQRFNTLILKIDKLSKWRVVQPMLFFGRRIVTAGLLCLPINNQYIFLQYIFILVTSHIYILYLVATKPYQTPVFNAYMLANETFYSALIILIFIFSDATPQLNIKVIAGGCLVTAIFLLVLANIVFIGYIVVKGKDRMKEAIITAKADRIKEEEQEREEEAKRQEKKKKEEEEFYKLPDDTNNVSQDVSNTTHHNNTTMADLNKKLPSQNKLKGNVDDVTSGPTPGKKGLNSDPTEYATDSKFIGKKGGARGKVSGEEKSSGSEKGPVIPSGKGKKGL